MQLFNVLYSFNYHSHYLPLSTQLLGKLCWTRQKTSPSHQVSGFSNHLKQKCQPQFPSWWKIWQLLSSTEVIDWYYSNTVQARFYGAEEDGICRISGAGFLPSTVASWVVVSIFFYFHPYLGKIPILTNMFQLGWNHQPVLISVAQALFGMMKVPKFAT